MTAQELAVRVVSRLNARHQDLGDIIEEAKDTELEETYRVLDDNDISPGSDEGQKLIEEMDGMILFVPEYYELSAKVKR